jgi:hypothetical protein
MMAHDRDPHLGSVYVRNAADWIEEADGSKKVKSCCKKGCE